jgi:hypothetical protein
MRAPGGGQNPFTEKMMEALIKYQALQPDES